MALSYFLCRRTFELLGFSLQSRRERGCRFRFLWPHILFVVYLLWHFFVFTKKHLENKVNDVVVMQVFSTFLLLTVVVDLVVIITQRHAEDAFWKETEELDSFFKQDCGFVGKQKAFDRRTFRKLVISVCIYSLLQASIVVAAWQKSIATSIVGTLILIPVNISRIFALKFIFHVDVLCFYLTQMRNELRDRENNVQNLQQLRKIYYKIWKLSRLIEDIFGMALVFLTIATILSAFYAGYSLCMEIIDYKLNVRSIFTTAAMVYGLALISFSIQNVNESVSIIELFH